jgi:hypothetical protein
VGGCTKVSRWHWDSPAPNTPFEDWNRRLNAPT